ERIRADKNVYPTVGKETWGRGGPGVRLGFRIVKGLREDYGRRVMGVRRRAGVFRRVAQFHRACGLPVHAVRRLAEADAFGSLGLSRREAVWEALELKDGEGPLFES